jgi:hypothetical protein
MVLPQFPTDSLYKFIFISGLTIMAASSILFITKSEKISNKLDSIEMDILNSELTSYSDSTYMVYAAENVDELLKQDSINVLHLGEQLNKNKKTRIPDSVFISAKNHIFITQAKIRDERKEILEKKISQHIESVRMKFKLKKVSEDTKF